MADNPTPAVIGTIELEHGLAPHKAQIIESPQFNKKYAVAVTEENGLQVENLETPLGEVAENPFRVTGERTVADLDSLLAELDRRPLRTDSTIWGKATAGRLTAIYNDHTSDDAGWRDDRLALQLTADEDWKAWHNISGKLYNQNDFGDVIENLLHTITSPDQAELLEVIDSIRSSTSGEFESKIERAHGGLKLTYREDHNVAAGKGRQLEVPKVILLVLRPWDGHPETYTVQADFRTRVNSGQLVLGIKLKPTAQLVRDAWYTVTQAVTGQTGKVVLAQP